MVKKVDKIFKDNIQKVLKNTVNKEFIKEYDGKNMYIDTNFIFNDDTKGEIFFVKNIFQISTIDEIIQKSNLIFFYYDKMDDFLRFLEKENIVEILKEKLIFFLFSLLDIEYIFYKLNVHFPHHYVNVDEKLVLYIETLKVKKIAKMKKDIEDYYNQKNLENIQKDTKVLLYNNVRFSKNLEKQWEEALKETDITLKKINDINIYLKEYYNEYEFFYTINSYKPDIMIIVETIQNQFEFYTPEKLIFVSWIDWPSKILGNEKRYIEHLRKYNLLLIPYITIENAFHYNFEEIEKYNTNIIKIIFSSPKYITNFKKDNTINIEKYQSDIAVVGGANSENWLDYLVNNMYFNNLKNKYGIKLVEFYEKIKVKIKNDYLKENKFIEEEEYYRIIIEENKYLLNQLYHNEQDILYLEYWIMFVIGVSIYRELVTEWLVEKNYNIKFWGDNWKKHDLVKAYAYPSVNYKELAKVYFNSKITLSTNPAHSIHCRVFEATLCDCMCLIFKPNKFDLASIKCILKEKESIDFFYDKNDLYDKIDYYLKYEQERKQIVKNAQRIIFNEKIYMEEILKDAIKKIKDNVKNITEKS